MRNCQQKNPEKNPEKKSGKPEIETGIQPIELMVEGIEQETVDKKLVLLALANFSEVFDSLKPYQQKDLIRLVMHKTLITPESTKIALYGRQPDTELLEIHKSHSEKHAVRRLTGSPG